MPRRIRPIKHVRYVPQANDKRKTRYKSQAAAEKAAELAALQRPNAILSAYQGIDGGWYLTSTART